jgi:hypothetical protein
LSNLENMEVIDRHCGSTIRTLIEETPELIINDLIEAHDKTHIKPTIYALFMTFITFLFKEELIMLKRKDKK